MEYEIKERGAGFLAKWAHAERGARCAAGSSLAWRPQPRLFPFQNGVETLLFPNTGIRKWVCELDLAPARVPGDQCQWKRQS